MSDSLFIFGNGLGKSICPDFFDLKPALEHAWVTEGVLTQDQKIMIQRCLPQDLIEELDETAPTNEEELEDLQRVLSACTTIGLFDARMPEEFQGWLTDNGKGFPEAIRQYLHQAACYFLDRGTLPQPNLDSEFAQSLRDFIMEHGASIGTLNYDDLLYEAFVGTEVFNQYKLRDGFFTGIFDFDKAEEYWDPQLKQGWFLHLHGSPLYLDKGHNLKKINRSVLQNHKATDSRHVVLTSVRFKQQIIQGSPILKEYWKKLNQLIKTANNVILFGYGGEDTHLNDRLNRNLNFTVRVVEYRTNQTNDERTDFWKQRLKHDKLSIIRLENVQTFRDWALPNG